MGKNPSKFKDDNHPVERVSWYDCIVFISRLNKETGRKFRLPTEAEWEFAARGGNRSKGFKYCGSDNVADVAWCFSVSDGKTHAIKTKLPNELGLFDMSGNVWEWCADGYGNYDGNPQIDPKGHSKASYRVRRGGGWDDVAKYCRVTVRYRDSPSRNLANVGLRLALSEE